MQQKSQVWVNFTLLPIIDDYCISIYLRISRVDRYFKKSVINFSYVALFTVDKIYKICQITFSLVAFVPHRA